ncbi:hypothetical protein HPT25_11410 [Bacillus sp. BRMEA1]|uniref:hypothetical protein n=1 Tax=Neobacillus endophyticus TaxID=2738405 RepID=UPI0015663384|nr:hypothetical protein [Neobacillus endophyticus]NRD77992.1 hypothetical protein [Neobacillus endophyticus]
MLTSFRKDQLLAAKNYALYYGYGRADELSLFDIAIVDPNGLKQEEFEQLRLKKTMVITYLSLLEVHPSEPIYRELSSEDFLLMDGKPVKNEAFGTFIMSLQSKKWMNHLLTKINRHFSIIESDGIFLDTIGDIEFHFLPEKIKKQQLQAAVNFLSVVKMLYPHHLFIQNNGLEMVAEETAAYIDGICWENPPFSLEQSKEWVEVMIRKLDKLKERHHVKIFLLLEETIEKERNAYEQAKKMAKKHDFLLYNASKNYVEGFNIVKG